MMNKKIYTFFTLVIISLIASYILKDLKWLQIVLILSYLYFAPYIYDKINKIQFFILNTMIMFFVYIYGFNGVYEIQSIILFVSILTLFSMGVVHFLYTVDNKNKKIK